MKQIIFTLFLCGLSVVGFAQKIPSLDVNRSAKDEIRTSVSLGGYFDRGNTNKDVFSAKAGVASVDSLKELSIDAKFLYGKNDDILNQKEFQAGLQFDYLPLSRFSPFGRIEFYSNEFKKISQRYSGLLGAKYRFYTGQREGKTISDYSISAALMFDSEHYIKETGLDSQEKFRLSVRPQLKQIITDNLYLQCVVFYKPNIEQWDDYLFYGSASLIFIVNKYINLSCSYDYDYNSRPATADVKKTDSHLTFNIGVAF